MIEFFMPLYPWFKWLHILSVISWMAGLLYLPRLFVYHVETDSAEARKMLEVMQERLMRIIMRPAIGMTWLTGILLALTIVDWSSERWIIVKILFVIGMSAFHTRCEGWIRQFAAGTITQDGRYFRIMNEVPTILMVFIVALVVFKPF